jgi:proteasome accessory factor C
MDRLDRIFQLHQILVNRRTPIPLRDLRERLECSRATINRAIKDMRNFLDAPIEYDRARNGYYYDRQSEPCYELPGLWFNSDELFALVTTQKLLADLQPGLLEPHLAPLRERIAEILNHRRAGHPDIEHRIRILQQAARTIRLEHFQKVATALLERRQIRILYRSRGRDELTERIVSPQRLVYYRDNWYLDAWCHLRKGLRSFSLDRMEPRLILDTAAKNIPDQQLQEHYADAYGIFAGKADKTAVLHFTPGAARWVADEHWHPQQKGKVLKDGSYELRVPYGNPTELLMDILKYGPDVEVLEPAELCRLVEERLSATIERYGRNH